MVFGFAVAKKVQDCVLNDVSLEIAWSPVHLLSGCFGSSLVEQEALVL